MFTLKLYGNGKQHIVAADSFSVIEADGGYEITAHNVSKSAGVKITLPDVRFDVKLSDDADVKQHWERAIIENEQGKTSSIYEAKKLPRDLWKDAPAPDGKAALKLDHISLQAEGGSPETRVLDKESYDDRPFDERIKPAPKK